MLKLRLTDAIVRNFELPNDKADVVIWDTIVTGFGLRLRPQRKTWIEYKALRVAHDMLDDPATSPTAKASIIRGSLSDSAARRNDDDREDSPFEGMSREEIRHAILVTERKLAMLERDAITNAEVEEVAPTGADVFG